MAINRAQINVDISSILAALGSQTNGPKGEFTFREIWFDGTTDRKAETHLFSTRTLGTGANEDIDLKTALDGNGVALAE